MGKRGGVRTKFKCLLVMLTISLAHLTPVDIGKLNS